MSFNIKEKRLIEPVTEFDVEPSTLTSTNWLKSPVFKNFKKASKILALHKTIFYLDIAQMGIFHLLLVIIPFFVELSRSLSGIEALLLIIFGISGLIGIVLIARTENYYHHQIIYWSFFMPELIIIGLYIVIQSLISFTLEYFYWLILLLLAIAAFTLFSFILAKFMKTFDRIGREISPNQFYDKVFSEDKEETEFKDLSIKDFKRNKIRAAFLNKLIFEIEENLVKISENIRYIPTFILRKLNVDGEKLQERCKSQNNEDCIKNNIGFFNITAIIDQSGIITREKFRVDYNFNDEEIDQIITLCANKSDFIYLPKDIYIHNFEIVCEYEMSSLLRIIRQIKNRETIKIRRSIENIAIQFENISKINAALKVYQVLEDRENIARLHTKIADQELARKKYVEAFRNYEIALNFYEQLETSIDDLEQKYKIIGLFLNGITSTNNNNYSEALVHFRKIEKEGLQIIDNITLKTHIAECLVRLGKFGEAVGYYKSLSKLIKDPQGALKYSQKAVELSEKLEKDSFIDPSFRKEIIKVFQKFKYFETLDEKTAFKKG